MIFYDPDNGLEVQSRGKLHPKSFKYVYFDEVFEAFKQEKSVVIYQHANRNKTKMEQIKSRVDQLKDLFGSEVRIEAVEGTGRFFLIVKHPKQADVINKKIKSLRDNNAIPNLSF